MVVGAAYLLLKEGDTSFEKLTDEECETDIPLCLDSLAQAVLVGGEKNMSARARSTSKAPSNKMGPKHRACLRCDRLFPSEGPYNRLCKACREYLNASPTPDEEYSIGYL
jgi:hypothetical protein